LEHLLQLARSAKDCDCMDGVEVGELHENYAAKVLLAAIEDMSSAATGSLDSKSAT
jgi:hypothetical protein